MLQPLSEHFSLITTLLQMTESLIEHLEKLALKEQEANPLSIITLLITTVLVSLTLSPILQSLPMIVFFTPQRSPICDPSPTMHSAPTCNIKCFKKEIALEFWGLLRLSQK